MYVRTLAAVVATVGLGWVGWFVGSVVVLVIIDNNIFCRLSSRAEPLSSSCLFVGPLLAPVCPSPLLAGKSCDASVCHHLQQCYYLRLFSLSLYIYIYCSGAPRVVGMDVVFFGFRIERAFVRSFVRLLVGLFGCLFFRFSGCVIFFVF